ncbi:MAG: 50S ribosomal protein L9 [candidate division WS1 bacterium]|nr:50S ribosomal protein L9 [candidate division WS1 bacterium]
MRVIFLHDVERVAHEGEVAEVADGYARNYLIPRGLAVKASKGALRELDERRSAIERRDQEKRDRAASLAQDLAQKAVVVKATVGEGQRLHGQVTAQQIAAAAQEQLELAIDRRDIEIPEPIRLLGDYLISARLYKDVRAELPVSVVPDRAPKEDEQDELAADETQTDADVASEAAAEDDADVAASEAATEDDADVVSETAAEDQVETEGSEQPETQTEEEAAASDQPTAEATSEDADPT